MSSTGDEEAAPAQPLQRGRHRLRELLYQLRVEGGSPMRQAVAIGLGIFIGCTPFYGLHLTLCVIFAKLLRVNRVKTYLAAHISTPVLMPFLLFFEVQTGRLVTGKPLLRFHASDVPRRWHWDARHLEFWHWKSWGDLLVGSGVLGLALGLLLGLLTYLLVRRGQRPREVEDLIEETAHRYIDAGLWHSEAVRGSLRRDPVYLALLRRGGLDCLPAGGRLVDLGCGRGVALALLATAQRQSELGLYPAGWPRVPAAQLIGVESDPQTARVARAGLGDAADIESGAPVGAVDSPLPCADAFLLIDRLHRLAPAEQESLLGRLVAALSPDGVVLIRETDAAAGWSFLAARLRAHLAALLKGQWRQLRQGFHYRRRRDWLKLLEGLGLAAGIDSDGGRGGGGGGAGRGRSRVLIRATRRSGAISPAGRG